MEDRARIQEALLNPESSAFLINTIISRKYGPQVYDFDPLTVALDIKDDYSSDATSEVIDKWAAVQIVMTTDAFFKRLDAFLAICNTLNNGQPLFQVFDPVTIEEAEWAITEVSMMRDMLPFSYPIRAYLKLLLKQDGYNTVVPDAISEALKDDPSGRKIRDDLFSEADVVNKATVDEYVKEQLKDLVYQWNKIDGLGDIQQATYKGD